MIVKTVQDEKSLAVNSLTVDLLNDFSEYLDVAPKTLQAYQKSLRQVFRYFSEQGISRPCQQDIINFKRGLEAKKRKPSTIALYLSACRRFFSWTEQRGIFPNIANGVKAPRQERGHKR
ncbi:MAG: site-specific integrase, partial [Synergistaceae bacterium]|nr:site-specific integrase [Synergistaceae bacterium]